MPGISPSSAATSSSSSSSSLSSSNTSQKPEATLEASLSEEKQDLARLSATWMQAQPPKAAAAAAAAGTAQVHAGKYLLEASLTRCPPADTAAQRDTPPQRQSASKSQADHDILALFNTESIRTNDITPY